jgi:GDP-mannose transporter
MVLLNKYLSCEFPVDLRDKIPQLTIILFQCVMAVCLVESAKLLKIVEYPNFNFKTAKTWIPVNILFIGMLISGFISLVYVSVPIVTVFKNMTNLITVSGDWYLFNERFF